MKLALLSESVKDLYQNAEFLGKLPKKKVQALLDKGSRGFNNWGDPRSGGLQRSSFVKQYSWSIPCKEAVDAIKKHAVEPIFDPMAGSGFWANLLSQEGLDVVASDLHVSKKHNEYEHQGKHGKVRRANAYQVAGQTMNRRGGSLILSWPPYDSPVGYNILKLIPVGTVVFYFGEGYGGCTGDDVMHRYLNENFEILEEVSLPQFDGIRDGLTIYIKESAEDLEQCDVPKCKQPAHPYKDGWCTRHYDIENYGACEKCGDPLSPWKEEGEKYCYKHQDEEPEDPEGGRDGSGM